MRRKLILIFALGAQKLSKGASGKRAYHRRLTHLHKTQAKPLAELFDVDLFPLANQCN